MAFVCRGLLRYVLLPEKCNAGSVKGLARSELFHRSPYSLFFARYRAGVGEGEERREEAGERKREGNERALSVCHLRKREIEENHFWQSLNTLF